MIQQHQHYAVPCFPLDKQMDFFQIGKSGRNLMICNSSYFLLYKMRNFELNLKAKREAGIILYTSTGFKIFLLSLKNLVWNNKVTNALCFAHNIKFVYIKTFFISFLMKDNRFYIQSLLIYTNIIHHIKQKSMTN